MRPLFFFCACVAACFSLFGAVPEYANPILPLDYSDPDVIRIGDTYLMTSSSFNNVPGLQILVSEDLVHWRIADAAIRHRLPGYEQGDKVLGNFVWAPSLREHDGRLYIFYGDPDRGIYCIRTQKGITDGTVSFPLTWEDPVLVMPGKGLIDPCPLWDDDGRVWLVHALAGSRAGLKSVLLMAELNADAMSVKTPSRIIFDGHEGQPTCEGPKLYRRNGYYYIMHPAGGVATGWQVVQRSRNIYGPYERRVTLQQGRTDVNGPHQGGWVETPEGRSWFVHFQDVGVAGRIVHLQPVQWIDDWPVMGRNGEPVTKRNTHRFTRRDDFDSTALALHWQWAGGYIDPKWSFCDAENGILRLYSAPATEELMPNMLLQKIPATAFTATAKVRFMPSKDKRLLGDERAGLIVFGRKVFMLEPPCTGEWIYLRLTMDEHQRGRFYTSSDGKKWTPAGEPFQAEKGYWTGAQVGFFCTRTKTINDSGWMDIDWFEML